MKLVSLIRLNIAVLVLGSLWLAALIVALSAIVRRRRNDRAPRAGLNPAPTGKSDRNLRRSHLGKRLGGWMAVAYLFATASAVPYSLYVEPYWPDTTHVEVESSKLEGDEPIRIVHLTDLHSDPEARLEDEIPKIVAALEPDVVVLTGDGVNSKEGIPVFRRCARALADRYPTYAVKGNWEAWWFKGIDVFAGTGVVELDGNAVPVTVGANRIWIAGVAVDNEHLIENALESVPPGELRVFLHHYPAVASTLSKLGVDIQFAGDTHGGQVRLPLLGELVRISRHGTWESTGLHRKGAMWLYVNRGVGMEGAARPD